MSNKSNKSKKSETSNKTKNEEALVNDGGTRGVSYSYESYSYDYSYENESSRSSEERGLFLPEHLEAHVKKVYDELKTNMKDLLENGLNSASVLELTETAMRTVGKIKSLVGYEKKVVVLSVIGKFVEETAKDACEKADELTDAAIKELEELRVMVDGALSPYIDQVYSLAPGLYGKAKKRFDKVKAFFKKLSCC